MKRQRSLRQLKLRGNKQMAAAHQAVADSQRIAHTILEMRAETKRLDDRSHGRKETLVR